MKHRAIFLILILVMALAFSAYAQNETYDVLIRNGIVYDGVSPDGKRSDIGIRGGKIEALGDLSGAAAGRTIDASGMNVAPGFIDIHTHSDFNPFLNPISPHKVLQGVTTEIAGNCGMSAAPVEGAYSSEIYNVWRREGMGIPENISWHSVREYFSALEGIGLMANFALLAGHGNLRVAVMGMEARKASPEEIAGMRALLDSALEDGALGLSLGLTYIPGIYADEAELIELARETGAKGGLVAVHMRSEGRRLEESLEETLAIARQAKVPLEISHLKAAGVKNWPKLDRAFTLIEDARREGLAVFADAYPYTASAAELGVILPDELYQAPDRLKRLSDRSQRAALKKTVQEDFDKSGISLDNVMIAKTSLPEHRNYEGKRLSEIAALQGKEPMDVLFDLLAEEDFRVASFSFSQSSENVEKVLHKEYVSVGSDNVADFEAKPHPRVYGTFPRVLEKFVASEKSMSLGETVRKMSALPAGVLGLKDRGTLEAGKAADIVIFDLAEVKSLATYENPAEFSRGMRYVLINGQVVVEEGRPTGVLAGQVLRRGTNGSSTARA